ncbi:hypothetical protein [Pasteurella phage PHB01]|uniref:Uncharacterized protein n=2 Tax=Wuhanvirus TaxID=2731989 RepID=A0A218M4G7_9CAUD|nr:hypothetical protein HOR82_gp18 [Pasteurella phage vB_PmuP_PHB02]YP_009790813.1 hypothetical protein HOR83_gp27 [Pasteurella phage PHB01]UIS73838.1 hypothetical protein [Pasteurella phage vB_PmuP_PS07]UIS74044.1 hypothetical protein [Pasteurella phage vB_PmuP_PS30]ARV77582.1 hypothetical protein [Pasteurella phage vB_PmuP_PHB02]ASD51043.1 hypothetical protein [Pasteurella phage PHB01]
MCFKPKIPKMDLPNKPIDPAPLTATPTGVAFGEQADDKVEEVGRKTLKVGNKLAGKIKAGGK